MSLCAICVSDRGPFSKEPLGRNNAMVAVCRSCSTEPAKNKTGPVLGYEIREGVSIAEMNRRLAATSATGVPFSHSAELVRDLSPGWILVRVRRRDSSGRPRDMNDAVAALRNNPQFADARYLGADAQHFLFERPDPKAIKSDENPLAAIEKWQVSP